jgi:hypothetical protein
VQIQYSRVAKDLATHGYLFIGINHHDGSNLHIVTKDGKDIYYGNLGEIEVLPLRKK